MVLEQLIIHTEKKEREKQKNVDPYLTPYKTFTQDWSLKWK